MNPLASLLLLTTLLALAGVIVVDRIRTVGGAS